MKKYILIILIPFLAFTLTGNPPSGWYQQFMPNLGGRSIQDIFFLDSLTGWAVTNATNQNPDTTYVLKTTNSGDNWVIQYAKIQTGGGFPGYFGVFFLDENTGYTCGVKGVDKTTDGGTSWTSLNAPLNSYLDMSVLNEDTIWTVSTNGLTGGVFRTTNGGVNWENQFSGGSQNPNKIYMYNGRIGYFSAGSIASPNIYKTTNSGLNWNIIVSGERFIDIDFTDSLSGWRAGSSILKKTTDGGLNWVTQQMPNGGIIFMNNVLKFSIINTDTVWANGGYVLYPNSQVKSILYRTTNGGINWLYQIPDTNLPYFESFIDFTDGEHGWAYSTSTPTGIHTVTGGDTLWTDIHMVSNEVPTEYRLYQNYPNPFNPTTFIKFKVQRSNIIKLSVFDIAGKEIATLVNEKLSAGEYEYKFKGNGLSSGVYFYSLFIEGSNISTKKMLLVK